MTTVHLWDREASATPPEFAGTERFELVRCIGRGGFGDVYEARDRELGRSVALKVLRRTSVRDLQSFKREFRGLADVRHPNLVQLLELHRDGDTWFFSMELVRGRSLRRDVWCHEPMPGIDALGEFWLRFQGEYSRFSDADVTDLAQAAAARTKPAAKRFNRGFDS